MPFTEAETQTLLAQKYVGATVIKRLEEIGIDNFEKLSATNSETICKLVAAHLGASCWGNSPQARQAIENAINTAKTNNLS
jgi:hypothetical protein